MEQWAYLQQQPLEGQAGVPAGEGRVAQRLGGGEGQLQHAGVVLHSLRLALEELGVGTDLLSCYTTCGEEIRGVEERRTEERRRGEQTRGEEENRGEEDRGEEEEKRRTEERRTEERKKVEGVEER